MTLSSRREKALDELCRKAIRQRLGDISDLPEDLVVHVLRVYRQFVTCYLNILRQRQKQPADWMPESLYIDDELVDGMRHFFSDYQHITRKFYTLDPKIRRLQQFDKSSQPNLYRHTIDDILKHGHRSDFPGDENDDAR